MRAAVAVIVGVRRPIAQMGRSPVIVLRVACAMLMMALTCADGERALHGYCKPHNDYQQEARKL